ncbi:hypothetical protein FRC04_003260 [Tulasnella sp. 424]|nr:hypothetical protein FRC04_003260 [Tulasnella sp. 424]KAG8965961.1 hypothetical protein FRC05_002952 [Tulasnella sp. 425]
MSTTLIPGLTFPSQQEGAGSSARSALPTGGQLLLVTDDLVSPADFLLYGAVNTFFKEHKTGEIVVVSSSDEAHWKAVLQKLGLNLAPHLTSNTFKLLDPSKFLEGSPNSLNPMRRLYDEINQQVLRPVDNSFTPQLLIVDDISLLDWISTESTEVIRFIRAIKHLATSSGTGVIIRYHSTSPAKPPPVLQHLMETCNCHVSINSLTSGRSGAVSGEVSIYLSDFPEPGLGVLKLLRKASFSAGPTLEDKNFIGRSKAQALHYRVDSSGFKFFDRGTAGSVL